MRGEGMIPWTCQRWIVQPIKQGCEGDFSLYLVKNKNKNEIEVNVQRNGKDLAFAVITWERKD